MLVLIVILILDILRIRTRKSMMMI